MAKEEKFYIDAEELSRVITGIPASFYINNNSSYYTGNGDIDKAVDSKINNAMSSIQNAVIEYHQILISRLSKAIEDSKKPYTACMLCNSNGQKTIDELENGE